MSRCWLLGSMIIGLGHKARRGKGAVAAHLGNSYGFQQIDFATALYDECRQLHGMTDKDPLLLQRWGQHRRDHDGQYYWVERVAEHIERNPADYVITDVRYVNEAAWVTAQGAPLWRVERKDGTLEDIGRDPNHESEIALDGFAGWQRTIWNDGSLDDLYRQIDTIMLEMA